MKKDRRKIDVIPVWRHEPDARLYALAVLELVKEQAAAAAKAHSDKKKKAGAREGASGE